MSLRAAMSADEAWAIVDALPPHHRDAFARSTLDAVTAYGDTGKVEYLEDFAHALLRSLDFRRRNPEIAQAMNDAPTVPVGEGRTVAEGFADIRSRAGA